MRPDLLAELAQIDGHRGRQAGQRRRAAADRRPRALRRRRRHLRAHAGHGRRRRDPRRQPRRRQRDAPDGRRARAPRRDRRVAARRLRDAVPDLEPDLHEGGAEPARPRRRRAAPAAGGGHPEERPRRCARCSSATASCRAHRPVRTRELDAARPAPRRARGDRQEHDGRRVRRPHRRGRRRAALPDARDGRHRPGAARLLLPARARHATSRRSSSPTATRTISARCRGCCASSASGRPAAGVRRRADDRDGALEARRAQAARRRAERGRARRDARAGAVLAGARAHDALDPRLERRRAGHRARHGADHRRLQVRPDARRRAARRRLAPGGARPRGRAAAVRRLDQRRPPRLLAVGVGRRAAPGGGVRALRGAHRGDELRVEHPPRAAGRGRRLRARSQGRAGRALDAQERRHRAHARPHRGPRRACSWGRARSTTSPTSAW